MNHLTAAVNAVHAGSAEAVLVYHAMYRIGGNSRSAGGDPFRQAGAARTAGRPGAGRRGPHRAGAVGHLRGRRLCGLGLPLPVRISAHQPRRLRPDRDQRPQQRRPQRQRGVPHSADHGGLSRRPDDPRAAVPAGHGRSDRRRGRVRRDHRRAGERPSAAARPGSCRDDGHGASPRGTPHHRSRLHRPGDRRRRPAGEIRPLVAGRRRPVPLRRLQLHQPALFRKLRLLRSRRGGRLPAIALGQGIRTDPDRRSGAGKSARRKPVRGWLPGSRPCPRSRPQLRGGAGERQVPDAKVAFLMPGGLFFNAQGLVLRAG